MEYSVIYTEWKQVRLKIKSVCICFLLHKYFKTFFLFWKCLKIEKCILDNSKKTYIF